VKLGRSITLDDLLTPGLGVLTLRLDEVNDIEVGSREGAYRSVLFKHSLTTPRTDGR
jgi:hypothetical protein